MGAPATGLLPGWGGWHSPKAAHGFLCGSRPQTPSLARWAPPRDEDRPMAGQGANSMAIARMACNGSISAAQVHRAAFDLEVRAARESMPAFGPARPAANGIEDGSKGTEVERPTCGRARYGIRRGEVAAGARLRRHRHKHGERRAWGASLERRRCRGNMASRFEGSALRQKESK